MRKAAALALVSAIALASGLSAQMLGWDKPSAASMEDFRFGLQAYNRGRFNEAILSFEKALSGSPEEGLVSFWLAAAYSRSGFEATAAAQLRRLIASGKANPFVLSREEALSSRAEAAERRDYAERLVETGTVAGLAGKERTFLRPTWIAPAPGGQYWLSSFGSDRVLRLDMNGVVTAVFAGPFGGLDRPFAAIDDGSGGVIVSEFGADRITRLDARGGLVARFGKKGRGKGDFLGPQYLCLDADGYLYVSDSGNRRVSKFAPDGSFVLSFGRPSGAFEGLSSPTGVAALSGRVYVADARGKRVHAFDADGNWLGAAIDEGLSRPEGLYAHGDSTLVIADGSSLRAFDAATGGLVKLFEGQEKRNRILCGMPDGAGGLIACDFDSSKVLYLSEASLAFSGFDVTVMRTNADRFPIVEAEVSVRDAKGRPVRGLNAKNFYVTEQISSIEDREEGGKPVSYAVSRVIPAASLEFLGEDGPSGEFDSVIVVDPSPDAVRAAKTSRDILAGGLKAVTSGSRFLGAVMPGDPPVLDASATAEGIASRLASARVREDWPVDAALRLAASRLASGRPRRAVFLFTSGKVWEGAFRGYGLGELAAFYANNRVQLNVVILGTESADEALRYVSSRSGGAAASLWAPEGLGPMVRAAGRRSVGTYALRFMSSARSDFGKAYMPFAVEAYLMKRSGRDESGYFAPLN